MWSARPPNSSRNVDSLLVATTFPLESGGRPAYMEINPKLTIHYEVYIYIYTLF